MSYSIVNMQTAQVATTGLEPANIGFKPVHEEFLSKGWCLTNNNKQHLVYTSSANQYDEFIIKVEEKCIIVSVPMPNSNIQYRTSLPNYFEACEYITLHLNNFMEKAGVETLSQTILPGAVEYEDD